ncbi:PREDICTED: mitochondrial fission 1 protein A-like [Ipomoea nil]|uniref:mitochondrial fission 1 protein A-like n=1 Tax=Ipomoea nil TaxID=35883 RepID=UPI0009011866|nr:PREDICTED: mitochondrial fission 1 protein A-like [Ipomoea nil]XP_019162284.1 PREDICTED: mitochondrial fission 1 protein A-like [Ipomoea nil]
MEAKITQLFDSVVTSFFNGAGDQLPWSSSDSIRECEREVTDAINDWCDDNVRSESIMRLSWALVHSIKPPDVQRGIAMLQASLSKNNSPSQKREKCYLLAVGYYRSGDYSRSRHILDQSLQIEPHWRQALSLKKALEDQITKDGVIGIGITATAVGLLAGIIAALTPNN